MSAASQVRHWATDDMEGALRSLAERHHTVLVLMDYKSVRPIRMRTLALLSDLDIEMVMAWKPGVEAVVERWRKRGGILQYRSNPHEKRPVAPVADAILFVECPMQWDRFETTGFSARQEMVVYRPPNWRLHNETIEHLYPRRESYEMIEAYMDALVYAPQSEYRQAFCAHSGFKRSVAFTAEDLLLMAGWDEKFLRRVLRRYKFTVHRWHPYTLRLRPDDADLRWGWRVLEDYPLVARRQHALRFNADSAGNRVLGFKRVLKLLVRDHYVRAEDCVYVADAGRKPVDTRALDAVHNMHRGEWFKLRNYVDDLPEYLI